MQKIDWSPMHDVLIRNPDGTLQPADEPYFQSWLIAPNTWRILSDGDYQYLVAGEKEALSIDSGYGCGDLRAYEQTLTDVPVRCVANTHDHFDHTANNCYFECAYMTAETQPLATIPFGSFSKVTFPRDYPVKIVDTGDQIDLGGRVLTIFKCPDHAVGSMMLLDPTARILFSGDEVFKDAKMLRSNVEAYTKCLRKVNEHRSEFDTLCAGGWVMEATQFDGLLACCEKILAGEEGESMGDREGSFHASPVTSYEPERNEKGQIVYARMVPHPEDRFHPEDKVPESSKLRIMKALGYSVTYNIENIYENQ